jgi:thiamine biosynthesis protein ThiI
MQKAVLLRYHEIALKGGNRNRFEKCLVDNAKSLLTRSGSGPFKIRRENGRVIVNADYSPVIEKTLSHLFGISSFSPMNIVPTDLEVIGSFVLEELSKLESENALPLTFRVFTRRSDKAVAKTSMQIDANIGAQILKKFPKLKVELKKPDLIVGIEIRKAHSYVWTRKVKARGGLPVGSNGPVLALLSGGLDSPVAALKTLRRGSQTAFLHFFGTPFVDQDALVKVEDLVRVINSYQPTPQPLHVVHFGKIQEKIALRTNPKMRTVIYRRLMLRIASRLAKELGSHSLITGECLGQVASQTIQNMAVIESASELPILRPLVTFDKDEIVKEAISWGTFDISIRPSADCCTLFADRHPVLYADLKDVEREEEKLDIESLILEGIANLELRSVL